MKKTLKIFITVGLILTVTASSVFAFFYYSLEKEMNSKIEAKKFITPTEFYAYPKTYTLEMYIQPEEFKTKLISQNFRQRTIDQRLIHFDFFYGSKEECISFIETHKPELHESLTNVNGCFGIQFQDSKAPEFLFYDNENKIIGLYQGSQFTNLERLQLAPELIAEYIDNNPIKQKYVPISEIPVACMNAIIAIEDSQFLEHSGVSYTGILRAAIKNLTRGRAAQGGSTITQQTVKNYFLTSERTLKRKALEFILSILLEAKYTKDQILETYLNIIYMGQAGAFQVWGYGAASEYYFNKKLQSLDLSQCALLAAIVNNPKLYNPFSKPENALKRRNIVLEKMSQFKLITDEEKTLAQNESLPKLSVNLAAETAPYYIDAVKKQLNLLNIPIAGTKIYTGLDLELQDVAQKSVQQHLNYLENNNKIIIKNLEKKLRLEGLLISANSHTGIIHAAVGGRSFKMTQFNRVVDAHRQVGSIMKPLVYLTALNNTNSDGNSFTPLTLLKDEKTTYKYEGQKWTPENYDRKYLGEVPFYFALKNSLNAPTAAVGMQIGLDKILDTAKAFGITSKLDKVPALTLGAFELYPIEVLRIYMALSQMGRYIAPSFVIKVESQKNETLFEHQISYQQVYDPATVAVLVGIMKQTILDGTAKVISTSGFKYPAAGKTGTTSDYKDSWFAGFTPDITTVSWVGYDDNTITKLTGSTGAVPIWLSYMQYASGMHTIKDFNWPEDVVQSSAEPNFPGEPEKIDLIFKKGTEP